MRKHKATGKKITVERISVTTIRTSDRSRKFYCEVCRAELAAAELVPQPLLLGEQPTTLELVSAAAANIDGE